MIGDYLMWIDVLAIVGACAAGAVFGIFVYWVINKIQKSPRASQSDSMNVEKQISSASTQDIEATSLKQPLNQMDNSPDIQNKTISEVGGDDWLNNEVPETSANIVKKEDDDWLNSEVPEPTANVIKKQDDDWLNGEVEEVPANVYKQQDDDWLNADNDQPMETPDDFASNRTTTNRPEIQVMQDGSTISITVITNPVRDTKPGTKGDNDWLNAEVEDVPTNVYKRQDDDWLNAGVDQPADTSDGSTLNLSMTNQREIQIEQDGSVLNITVTASKTQDPKSEQTVISLIIDEPPQDLPKRGEWLKDTMATADYISPTYASLQDITAVKVADGPAGQSHPLMDEISVVPVVSTFTVTQPLIDEIIVRPTESTIIQNHALLDEISVKAMDSQLAESLALMDEITVRPTESTIIERYALVDEISIESVQDQVVESHSLMDEISTKPSSGQINLEYELLDDLITKTAMYRTKKAIPFSDSAIIVPVEKPADKTVNTPSNHDAAVTNPEESPVKKAELAGTVNLNEITEFLNEKRVLRQAAIAPVAVRRQRASIWKSPILSLELPIAPPFKVLSLSLVYLIAIVIAELIIYRVYPAGGVITYLVILFCLIISSILSKDQSQRDFSIALGLAPLIRIFSLAIPGILVISQYLWYIVASIPIISGIISISRTINLNANDIGLNFNKPFVQFLVAITGIGLAIVDFRILKPAGWTSTLTIQETLFPAIVLLIFTGLIEELSFRGVMQHASKPLGSYGWIFVAVVYGVLQIWQGSVLHCIFSFGVGLYFGWIVKKTGSILGVSGAHGLINIGLYLIFPHIF
jgi:uncharacterized protein